MAKNRFTNFKKWAILAAMFLCLSSFVKAQWVINEGFEGGSLPSGWTYYDVNNDGSHWRVSQHAYAHSGTHMAFVDCYGNNGNDWLVTPQITVLPGYVFKFYARSWFSTENMNVKLSTTGNAISNFTVNLQSVTGVSTNYVEYSYDLSAYAGQHIYLAIQWLQDNYALIVDDIKIGKPITGDAGVISINNPLKYNVAGSQVSPVATIKNFGTSDITTDFPVQCTIKNAAGNAVYSNTITHTGTLASGATQAITFPQWATSDTGIYHVYASTFLTGDGDPSNDTLSKATKVVLHYGTGGPDAQSYQWIDNSQPGGPSYNWIEINTTGTSTVMYGVNSFAGDDNFSEPIPIGFDFPFYGYNRDHFYADVNGELLLTDNQWYRPFPDNGWDNDGNIFNFSYPIPGYSEMPALIAVYWDDLFADQGTGNVYFQTFGTAPNRYCVIEWNNLRFSAGTGGSPTLCFEAILYENGNIIMQYKNVANGQSGSNAIHDYGQSATVAVQNDDASAGLSYLTEIVENNQYIGPEPPGNLLTNGLAIKFFMGEDTQPPILSHESMWNTFIQTPEIKANINDISGIASDTLYYNIGNGWQASSHTSFEEPNIYHYQLPVIPKSKTINYYFAATDNSVNHNRSILTDTINGYFSFKILPTDGVSILFATPGNKPGYQDYQNKEYPKYLAALNAAGVSYDIYNWAEFPTYRFPDSYKTIIAYSNNSGCNGIQDTLSVALMKFMDSGTEANPKNVFMASDQLANMQNGQPNASPVKKLFTAYFRGGYNPVTNPPYNGGSDGIGGPDAVGYNYGSIIGLGGSPIGQQDVEIPVYSDSPDVIYNSTCPEWYANEVSNPEISSWGSFVFNAGPFDGNAYSKGQGCGLWLDNLIYKSFFLSFDISQFTSDDDINNTISQALDWFFVPGNDVNGTITYPNTANTPLSGVVLNLKNANGNIVGTTNSDAAGEYTFSNVSDGNYTVEASINLAWTGVSATDVLLYKKHIANISQLSGIFLASGDVNASGDVTATDVLLIKKRIAHITNSFSTGDWLFNPTTVTVNGANASMNFNGIIYGDANASYTPAAKTTSALLPTSASFAIPNVTSQSGQITVPVYATDVQDLGSFQFSIAYDPARLQFIKADNWFNGIQDVTVGNPVPGKITFVWATDNSGISILNDKLFDLHFTSLTNETSALTWNDTPTLREFADWNGNVYEPALTNGSTDVMSSIADIKKTDLVIYPNPSAGAFTLTVNQAITRNIDVTVYNASGMIVYQKLNVPANGNQTIEINPGTLPEGVYMLNIKNVDLNLNKQLVISK